MTKYNIAKILTKYEKNEEIKREIDIFIDYEENRWAWDPTGKHDSITLSNDNMTFEKTSVSW